MSQYPAKYGVITLTLRTTSDHPLNVIIFHHYCIVSHSEAQFNLCTELIDE